MVMDGLSLDIEDVNRQIEEETLMPAELVRSEYREYSFTNDRGETEWKKSWTLEWDRLDIDTTGSNGEKFLYRSGHNLPDANRETPVTNRRNMTYVQQIECFGKLGLRGRSPEDFIGAKHWIQETVSGRGQFTKTWYKSVAQYIEGQSKAEAMGGTAVHLNPPEASSSNGATPDAVVSMDDSSPYTVLLTTIDGKSQRQALTAIRNTPELAENTELMAGVQSGELFDNLIEQGFLREGEDGKFVKLEPVEAA